MATNKLVLKVVLVGEYGVGKSSLFRRFAYDSFVDSADRASTLGFDHFEKTYLIDGKQVVLQLWDTGGLERVASVTTSYFKNADGAILCFAYDQLESFNALSQHILEVVSSAESAKLFLCGTRLDLHTGDNGPSEDDIATFYRENQVSESENLFTGRFGTSSKDNSGVHEMLREVAECLAKLHRPARPDLDHFRLRSRSLDPARRNSCCS